MIEIDGESQREKFGRDQAREKKLEEIGLMVLRFGDRDVKKDIGNVLSCLQNWIEQKES